MNKRKKLNLLYSNNNIKNRIPNRLYKSICKRLCRLNQLSPKENLINSIRLSFIFIIASAIYYLVAQLIVDGLWYHDLLIILSTVLFYIVIKESYFESLEKNIEQNLPKLISKILHYYTHYNFNIIVALEEAEKRSHSSVKIFASKIRDALLSADYENKIKELQEDMPLNWLKTLCVILLFAKKQGVAENTGNTQMNTNSSDPISLNLRKMIRIINFTNVEQKQNTTKLIGYQLMSFMAPLFTIPVVKIYYRYMDTMVQIGNPYADMTAQTLAAILLFAGNASALYIHWLRKLQH